jgi:hypothetical protein
LGVLSKLFYTSVLPNKGENMSCWDVLPGRYPLSPAPYSAMLDERVALDGETLTDMVESERGNVSVVSKENLGAFLSGVVTKFLNADGV